VAAKRETRREGLLEFSREVGMMLLVFSGFTGR
jgi:hypothetical protein